MAEDKTVHCPHCGNDKIYEKNTAYAELLIEGWELNDGETKVVAPADYDLDVETDWETVDGPAYICKVCEWVGDATELIVRAQESRHAKPVSSEDLSTLLVQAHRAGVDIGDLLATACRDAAAKVKDDLTIHRSGSWEAEHVRALSAGWQAATS